MTESGEHAQHGEPPAPGAHRLPRPSEARIEPAKLRDYALNTDHAVGGHKARVFQSALGFQQTDWEDLRDQILERVGRYPVTRATQRRSGAIRVATSAPS